MPLSLLNKKGFVAGVVFILAALLTQARSLQIFGLNPNLFLAVLAAWVFFMDKLGRYIFLSALGAVVLKTYPAFEWPSLVFMILPAIFFGLKLVSPLHPLPTVLVLAVLGTIIFYAVINYGFLANDLFEVTVEGGLNAVWAGLIFGFLKRLTSGWIV